MVDKTAQKSVMKTIIVAVAGILIGLAGELMPESFQKELAVVAADTFGISYTLLWVIMTAALIGTMLLVLWKQGANNAAPPTASSGRVIHQQGDKSVYIEKNNGDIHIE